MQAAEKFKTPDLAPTVPGDGATTVAQAIEEESEEEEVIIIFLGLSFHMSLSVLLWSFCKWIKRIFFSQCRAQMKHLM